MDSLTEQRAVRCTSHVTRLTSHFTRYKSHITRHTSHFTQTLSPHLSGLTLKYTHFPPPATTAFAKYLQQRIRNQQRAWRRRLDECAKGRLDVRCGVSRDHWRVWPDTNLQDSHAGVEIKGCEWEECRHVKIIADFPPKRTGGESAGLADLSAVSTMESR